MNIKAAALKEHSKAQTTRIVRYVGKSQPRFTMLVNAFIEGPYQVTQRLSWPLSICVELNPPLAKPHLKRLTNFLLVEGTHDAVKRNILRLFQFIDLPKKLQGKIATVCYQYLENTKEPVAIRVFAMSILAKIAVENPELKNELIALIDHHLPYASAGYKSRAKKVSKLLQRD
jgi:hypothetical protein